MGREKTSGSNGQLSKLTKISKAKKPGGGGVERGLCAEQPVSLSGYGWQCVCWR